ncbi:dephospho-CoA kinase [Candidatus Poribacteria bacterium]|nr:dephospho-CoA kinase [Candidatus Poribacteria bacterium]
MKSNRKSNDGNHGIIVGLTGGIACGKTTVSEIFKELGADIINADLIGHEVLKEDKSVKDRLVATFGQNILGENREISRYKLGNIAFDNKCHLDKINKIVHPAIIRKIQENISQKTSSIQNNILIIEAPLLIEVNLINMVDVVVVVYADEDKQIKRLNDRGLSENEALKRIKSQMPVKDKLRYADFVIYNNDSISNTRKRVVEIWGILQDSLKGNQKKP